MHADMQKHGCAQVGDRIWHWLSSWITHHLYLRHGFSVNLKLEITNLDRESPPREVQVSAYLCNLTAWVTHTCSCTQFLHEHWESKLRSSRLHGRHFIDSLAPCSVLHIKNHKGQQPWALAMTSPSKKTNHYDALSTTELKFQENCFQKGKRRQI